MHKHLKIQPTQPIQKIPQSFSQHQNQQYPQNRQQKHNTDDSSKNYQTNFNTIIQKNIK